MPIKKIGVLAFASAAVAVGHNHHQHNHLHARGTGTAAAPALPTGLPACWGSCFQKAGVSSPAALCDNAEVSECIKVACATEDTASYDAWLAKQCHSDAPYPVGNNSTAVGPTATGGYSTSVCTETSTLIYKTTTEYSTYLVTHTLSASAPGGYGSGSGSSDVPVSPATESAPAPGGYESGAPGGGSYTPGSPAGGDGECSDVTVTTTERTTVTVTAGSGSAPSSAPAAASSSGLPSCWTSCFSSNGVSSQDAACDNDAVSGCIKDTCSEAEAAQFESWAAGYCGAASSSPASPASTTPASYATAPSSAPAAASSSGLPSCWTSCFSSNGISSQDAACDNDAVSGCIKDTCSEAEAAQFESWAAGYCGGASAAPSSYVSQAAAPSSWGAPSTYAPASSSSASSPKQSSPPTYDTGFRGKRGIAYNDSSMVIPALMDAGKVGWASNWEGVAKGFESSDITFIPTLHSSDSYWTGMWTEQAEAAISQGLPYLFGPNEPDIPSQANMLPSDCADFWREWMEPYAGRIGLVAPSVSSGVGSGIGLDWLDQFMGNCSDCTFDAVNQHWYNSEGNDVQNFKDTVSGAAKYGPVFVGEFGAVGSDSDISGFMDEVMPWMDSNSDVLGYAYFMAYQGLLVNGDALSPYGETYCNGS